jgi:hypothetical protein
MAKQVPRVSRRKATEKELPGAARDGMKKRRTGVDLEIETPIGDEAVRGLLDDWLVPMIVNVTMKRLGS